MYRDDRNFLFRDTEWHEYKTQVENSLIREIENYHENSILNTPESDLIDYFVSKYELDVPTLERDQMIADQSEVEIDVSQDRDRVFSDRSTPFYVKGTQIVVEIPFSGNSSAFRIQPSSFYMNPPRGDITGQTLKIRIEGTNLQAEQVKSEIDNKVSAIERDLNNLRTNAGVLNSSLGSLVATKIQQRKEKLLKDKDLVASIGIPLKKREGVETYKVPVVRKKIPTPPKASQDKYVPEPELPTKEYLHILEIIEQMTHVMEMSPSAFGSLGEEDLRSHYLVQLNAQYKGQATGETFNYKGKTDIIIKANGKNIFIAECKFWGGRKKYLETIDQVLNYLSWRDTKVAIILFSKNKKISKVIEEVKDSTKEHDNYKRELDQRSETSFVYKFSHKNDPEREMTLTTMIFSVPS